MFGLNQAKFMKQLLDKSQMRSKFSEETLRTIEHHCRTNVESWRTIEEIFTLCVPVGL